jgi:hypothetical protein
MTKNCRAMRYTKRQSLLWGRSLPVVTTACAGQVECKRLVSTDAIDWSVAMQMGGQVHAITQLRTVLQNTLMIEGSNLEKTRS